MTLDATQVWLLLFTGAALCVSVVCVYYGWFHDDDEVCPECEAEGASEEDCAHIQDYDRWIKQ